MRLQQYQLFLQGLQNRIRLFSGSIPQPKYIREETVTPLCGAYERLTELVTVGLESMEHRGSGGNPDEGSDKDR